MLRRYSSHVFYVKSPLTLAQLVTNREGLATHQDPLGRSEGAGPVLRRWDFRRRTVGIVTVFRHGEGLDQLFGYEVMESGDFNDFTQGT